MKSTTIDDYATHLTDNQHTCTSPPCTEETCCEGSCNMQTFVNGCDVNGTLFTQSTYCNTICTTPNDPSLLTCEALDSENPDCTDCNFTDCVYETNQAYLTETGSQPSTVCSTQ